MESPKIVTIKDRERGGSARRTLRSQPSSAPGPATVRAGIDPALASAAVLDARALFTFISFVSARGVGAQMSQKPNVLQIPC